jgi:hypothetical protein
LAIGCTKKTSETPEENSRPSDISANLLAAGASANDILSNDKFTKMKIEIAYVVGFKPTNEAMSEFVDFLKANTLKENIELVFTELPSPEEETLTIDEIAELEDKNRTVYTQGDTVGVYIYFADAPSDEDDEEEDAITLGAVYRNTTMVVHQTSVRRIGGRSVFISIADVEIATINHEFGHLFGLVNLGTPQVNDHEDSEAANHCIIEGCLMRAKLQFGGSSGKITSSSSKTGLKSSCSINGGSILSLLENNTAKGFSAAVPLDSECILDLKSNGGR